MVKQKKSVIGGQALIEGVLMRNKTKIGIAVRKPDGSIKTKQETLSSIFFTHSFFKLPFIRGVVNLLDTIIIVMKALNYSANEALDDAPLTASKKTNASAMNAWHLATTFILALLFSILLFVILPLYLTSLFTDSHGFIFNLIDGILRIVIFFVYILVISLFPDVRRVFQYHGAEHKSVFCYEAGEKLIPKNVQKYSTLHPRCGTTFLIIVLIISIILFSVITHPSWIVKFGVRILFIPVIAALSYELLHLGGRYFHNPLVKLLVSPGLLLQKITTRQPTNKQVEVAIAALKEVV